MIDDMKKALDGINKLQELSKQLDNIELREQIVELKSNLLEVQEANHSLIEEVRALKEQLNNKSSLNFDERWGYFYKEEKNHIEVYCPKCHQGHDRLSRMKCERGARGTAYRCNTCGLYLSD